MEDYTEIMLKADQTKVGVYLTAIARWNDAGCKKPLADYVRSIKTEWDNEDYLEEIRTDGYTTEVEAMCERADKRETSGFRALDHSINPYNYITDDQLGSAVKEFFKQN